MSNKVKITLTFGDIVNVLMWDDSFNKEGVSSKIPCGKKVTDWLARAFTLSNMKNFADKPIYALSFYYKKTISDIEESLKVTQDFYSQEIKNLKKVNSLNPLSLVVSNKDLVQPTSIETELMACPLVLMFIRCNILCDLAHSELKNSYQTGVITSKEYYSKRRELFKPINKFRADMASKVQEAGRLYRKTKEKTDT